jgi:hypothetical protein
MHLSRPSFDESAAHLGATSCNNCARRNVLCHFSSPRKPRKRKYPDEVDATPTAPSRDPSIQHTGEADNAAAVGMSQYDGLQELYVDRLLSGPPRSLARVAQKVSLQVSTQTWFYHMLLISASRASVSLVRLSVPDYALFLTLVRERVQLDLFLRGAAQVIEAPAWPRSRVWDQGQSHCHHRRAHENE